MKTVSDRIEDAQVMATPTEPTEDEILHKAVGIMRKRMMTNINRPNQEYYSSSEMSVKCMKDFVDPMLYKMIRWLTNGELFRSASSDGDDTR